METFDAVCKRTSIRQYKKGALDKNLLSKLVDAGRRAPSAKTVEPWEFVVVTRKKVLDKLGQLAVNGSFVKDASAAIVVFCKDTKYYLEDGCAATENILLTAAAVGLGACWIAGDKKDYAKEVGILLGAPAHMKLVSLVSLGLPERIENQAKVRGLEEVIHWEMF